ncbi:MerR family transcriptional regulator [Leucobacter tenebrionis]|uniref:MerR family transcriptional regulator n=1 Tax=Leucobacter tenebrionis TaxID=2873270 RepID=UPI001CA68043|nr:MerR family transcriptional regulator [Leucobacter tenebrionis]QZY51528.1 MerR family transcriptional regulator [Leucobacter tenebrionis]
MSVQTAAAPLTVGAVAGLVGVSIRTLHHWDEIGLVHPSNRTAAGYRSYSADDIGRIYRVLVYRELGFSLAAIAELLDDPTVDAEQHLREQRRLLDEQITQLQHTANAVDRLLSLKEAGAAPTLQQQAEIFGRSWRQDWAVEAQERWGGSGEWRQFKENAEALTSAERVALHETGEALYGEIAEAVRAGIAPTSPEAAALAVRHREMFGRLFTCTPSMHALLGRMFVDDPRFRAFFDGVEPGLSVWLRDAIFAVSRAAGVDPYTAVWE